MTTELDTFDVLECSMYCLTSASMCKSINYKARNRQKNSKNCQLNDATAAAHHEDLQVAKNFDYYHRIEKVFSMLDIAELSCIAARTVAAVGILILP